MSAGNEAWIQDSLARLEQLEAHRQRIAAVGRPDELAEIDEEIKSLYEVLEAAAEQGYDQPANQPPAASPSAWGDIPHPAFGPTPGAPAPVATMQPAFVAAPSPAPFAESPFAAPPPQAVVEVAPAFTPSYDAPSYDTSGLDDEPKRGNGALMGIAIVAVLGLGGGSYWIFGRPKPVEPPPAAPTEVQVFKAGSIPADTQEPQVAKGGDASRTPTVTLGGSDDDDRRRSASGSRSSSSSGNRPAAEPEKPTGRSIKVEATDDPLAGVK